MVRALVLRGLAVGALGGLVAFVFARIFSGPLIQAAIDYESARDEARGQLDAAAGLPIVPAEPEMFSRGIQANLGAGLGMVLFGLALGALFSVAYCLAWGRAGRLGPRPLALLVALGGFVTLYLVPFLKYPANPPAVGNEDTIGARTSLYLVMVVGAVLAALGAVWLRQRMARRWGSWNATVAGVVGFVVLVGLLMALLPSVGELPLNVAERGGTASGVASGVVSETPGPLRNAAGEIVFPGYDADLLYWFRLYSVGAQLLLWAVIGLCFAPLADRVLGRPNTASPTAETASATSG